jgi:hypothetical protein
MDEKSGKIGISYVFPKSNIRFTASGSVVVENISEVAMKNLQLLCNLLQ